MIQQFCHLCNQPLKKVGDIYICPIHGKVLREVNKEESEEKDKSYIG